MHMQRGTGRVEGRRAVGEEKQSAAAILGAFVVTVVGTMAVIAACGHARSGALGLVLLGIGTVGARCGAIGWTTRSCVAAVLAGGVGLAVGILVLLAFSGGSVTRASDVAFLAWIWVLLEVVSLTGFGLAVATGYLFGRPGGDARRREGMHGG